MSIDERSVILQFQERDRQLNFQLKIFKWYIYLNWILKYKFQKSSAFLGSDYDGRGDVVTSKDGQW